MVNSSLAPLALLSFLMLGGLAGCSQSLDPCPLGSTRSDRGDKCVRSGPSGTGDGDGGIDAQVPGGDGDKPVGDGDKPVGDGDKPVGDGDKPVGDGDAQVGDGDAPVGDGDKPVGDGDGGPDATDRDGGPDADAGAVADSCEADGIGAWSAFHTAAGLVTKIGVCTASDPSCDSDQCALGDCLRKAANVNGCATCVSDEVVCVATQCQEACSGAKPDSQCRACACTKGCVGQFDTCSGAVGSIRMDVCSDCDDNDCGNMSVMSPELIMVVVNQILFAPALAMPVMP
jgi:hypothetical protein